MSSVIYLINKNVSWFGGTVTSQKLVVFTPPSFPPFIFFLSPFFPPFLPYPALSNRSLPSAFLPLHPSLPSFLSFPVFSFLGPTPCSQLEGVMKHCELPQRAAKRFWCILRWKQASATVTEALVLRSLLEDRGCTTESICILVPVDRTKQNCF